MLVKTLKRFVFAFLANTEKWGTKLIQNFFLIKLIISKKMKTPYFRHFPWYDARKSDLFLLIQLGNKFDFSALSNNCVDNGRGGL